ncbi:MAG: DUF2723 domain-containing protein [Chitinophagaceae bacterium]|nr:DUF2723 domain-containing protein [Chitinophagaceae bacterium]
MNFKRINNITGWVVCFIACTVYIMTMEASGSLWDCGEFASSAYKLQIPHPPGAPLFVLIGRLFMAPFGPAHAATGINLMSALASGFTILFLFWSITHFARKIVSADDKELTQDNIFSIMAAGVVGALAYTFSDSFWFSAVEGEVYALSSFFTAIVFWAMLKWEHNVTEEQKNGIKGHFTKADRWIILIFYLMGLSIGVHLLNLLAIPALVLIYYYKRYKVTKWGAFWAFVIGCGITGLVQKAVIQWSIKGAGNLDIFFVNSFKLPFFSGFAFFFVLMAALAYFGFKMANKNGWNFLKLGLWSFLFMLLGYSTYFTTLVRSSANPSVDMFNVDNPVNLVGYVSREQYGDWPILYGQDFTAEIQDTKITETYIKTDNGYEKNGRKVEYVFAPQDKHLFPRMWDMSNDQQHADYYASWAGINKDEQGRWDRSPTMAENIGFFMSYQVNWMYWRYFLWNFAGKQNDVQGVNMGNVRDGNWKTGIGFFDKIRLGDQNKLPDTLKNNKANNKLFALPFILGILGLMYQVKKDKRDAFVTGLLFFFTGFAIVIYLNQAGNQPRERDYAFVGSFYAFAIWIGLGVFYVRDLIMPYIKNIKTSNIIAGLLCLLAVPVLMASQEWNDHDRSKKLLAPDLATDYLESCAPNAIVISFGDNDTYPLWFAQEVLGVRKDIRVINSSLLGTDWYINQLRYKINDSNPIDPIWSKEQIQGSSRDVIYEASRVFGGNAGMANQFLQQAGITDPSQPMDLYTMMKDFAGSDSPNKTQASQDGTAINIFPTRKVSIPVDVNLVRQNKTVNADDSVLSSIQFEIPKSILYKNDAAILNIIAANKWKRPIYFTSPYGELGFGNFLRQDGLTYRLVPVANNKEVNRDWVVDKMGSKFKFGNANVQGVYFDEENRRHLNTIRLAYASAARNLAENGRKEDARKLLNKCDQGMLQSNMPYGMVSRGQQQNQISLQMALAAYIAEDTVLATKITNALQKDMEQQQAYYESLPVNKRDALSFEEERNAGLLNALHSLKQQFAAPVKAPAETTAPLTTQPVAPKPVDSPKK